MKTVSSPDDRATTAVRKTSPYHKPALRELAAGEHAAARATMQDFLAQAAALGKEPSQENFEAYLQSRRLEAQTGAGSSRAS